MENHRQEYSLTRKDVFLIIKEDIKQSSKEVMNILARSIETQHGKPVEISDNLKKSLPALFSKFRSRWEAAKRDTDRFFKKNEQWLRAEILFPTSIDKTTEIAVQEISQESISRGRPSKSFESSSDRSKRRKTEEIRKNFTLDELSYAIQMNLRSTGNLEAAKVVKDVSSSPTTAHKYVTAYQCKKEETLSPDEALSLLIETKSSKRSYQMTRNEAKKKNCKLFPSYKHVEKAKAACYLPNFYVQITETSAEVKLQVILDKTVSRILQLQDDVVRLSPANINNLILYCKWGCDRSPGQSIYKQKFSEDGNSDKNGFFTSFVPLKLISKFENTEIIIWQNPRPSSPRFCRPIRLQFLHENVQTTGDENIEEQIQRLEPFKTTIHEKPISVTYNLAFTIDDKVCNKEDAQESWNKNIKRFCEDFSRKCSRKANMMDVFNRLMLTSDPLISSVRKLPQKPAHINENDILFHTSAELESLLSSSGSESESNLYAEEENDFCY